MQEQVDRFDVIHNTERPHQGLPGRVTPQDSWDATLAAEPPGEDPAPRLRLPAQDQVPDQQTAAGQTIHAVWAESGVVFADTNGEVLIERAWPPKGQTYVSNGIRRGRPSQ